MACFADINLSQGSVATYARCRGIFDKFLNLLRIDRIMVMSLWPVFCPPCTLARPSTLLLECRLYYIKQSKGGKQHPKNCHFPWVIHSLTQHMVSWAHPNLQHKQHVDWISGLSTAHRKLYLQLVMVWDMFPQNCHFPGGSRPQPNTCYLGLPDSTIQTASQLVRPFLQGSRLCATDRKTALHR